MNGPGIGTYVTLTGSNHDQVLRFIRRCSDWVAADQSDSSEDSAACGPGRGTVLVTTLNGEAHVRIGATVTRTGGDEIAIGHPEDGEVVISMGRGESVSEDLWVRAYYLRVLAELSAARVKVEGRADVRSEFPNPAIPRIELYVRECTPPTAVQRFWWDARGGWAWTKVRHMPHNDSDAWVDMALPVEVDAPTFAAVALRVCRDNPS